jgi:hypothetical protein
MTFQEGRRERGNEVSEEGVKVAVTVLFASMVMVVGFVLPVRSPDQPLQV